MGKGAFTRAGGWTMEESRSQLDDLYQALSNAATAARRAYADVVRSREALQSRTSEFGEQAESVAQQCHRATAIGDAQAAAALLELQRELLHSIEDAGVELRLLTEFEPRLMRQVRLLQQTADDFRTAKESAKAEMTLGRVSQGLGSDPQPGNE